MNYHKNIKRQRNAVMCFEFWSDINCDITWLVGEKVQRPLLNIIIDTRRIIREG